MNFKVIYLFLSRLWMMPTPMYQWPLMVIVLNLILHFLTESLVLSNDHQRWWSQEYLRFNAFRGYAQVDRWADTHCAFPIPDECPWSQPFYLYQPIKKSHQDSLLYYESNGFWLFIKRLEHGKFKIQESQESLTRAITSRQLSWLLEGLEYDEKLKEKQLLI